MCESEIIHEKISKKLYFLCKKLTEVAVLTEIIDPYYNGFEKNQKTFPFAFLIQSFTKDLFSDLYILSCDHCNGYDGYSLTSIIKDTKQCIKDGHFSGYKESFDNAVLMLQEIKKELESVKIYRDKYHAHLDYNAAARPNEINLDKLIENYNLTLPSWAKFINCLQQAKEVYNALSLYWEGPESDFANSEYADMRRRFWECTIFSTLN